MKKLTSFGCVLALVLWSAAAGLAQIGSPIPGHTIPPGHTYRPPRTVPGGNSPQGPGGGGGFTPPSGSTDTVKSPPKKGNDKDKK